MAELTTGTSPLRVRLERDGALLHLTLDRPKANLIDAAMIAALSSALSAHRGAKGLRGVLLDHVGPHFSFGASVEEHLPAQAAAMLASLHALIGAMLEFPAPILAAVRGQCLGGGLEVALAAGPIFAAPDAKFGQPEIKLGVFAPAASVPAALAGQPGRRRRTCCCPGARSAPTRRAPSGWCSTSPTIRPPRRSPGSTSTSPGRAALASLSRCRPRAAHARARRGHGSPTSSGSTSTA